jgi:hypothetical protein
MGLCFETLLTLKAFSGFRDHLLPTLQGSTSLKLQTLDPKEPTLKNMSLRLYLKRTLRRSIEELTSLIKALIDSIKAQIPPRDI